MLPQFSIANVVLAAYAFSTPVYASDAWRVQKSDLICVISHLQEYLSTDSDPVMIVLPACPETDTVKAFQKVTTNSMFAAGDSNGNDDSNTLDNFVFFRPKDLACLEGFVSSQKDDVILIPKTDLCGR